MAAFDNLTPAQKRSVTILQKAGLLQFTASVSPSTIPSVSPVRTFASKAERAAGNGFQCPQCARNDLRVAPKSGSFHERDQKTDARVKDYCTIA